MAGPRGQHRLRRGRGAYAATAVRARTVRHRALHRHYSYCRGRDSSPFAPPHVSVARPPNASNSRCVRNCSIRCSRSARPTRSACAPPAWCSPRAKASNKSKASSNCSCRNCAMPCSPPSRCSPCLRRSTCPPPRRCSPARRSSCSSSAWWRCVPPAYSRNTGANTRIWGRRSSTICRDLRR